MAKRKNEKPRKPDKQEPVDQQAPVVSRESIAVTSWEGPMPPPATLKEYEAVLPDSAERILKMTEK